MTAMNRCLFTLLTVSVVIASSMASRNVMIMTRTLTSHSSQVRSLKVVAITTTFQRDRTGRVRTYKPTSAGFRQMWATANCTARSLAGQLGDHREQRHVERNDNATDRDAEKRDQDRLQHRQHVLGRRIHLVLIKVGDLLQHVIHRARSFADADHLRDHVGK